MSVKEALHLPQLAKFFLHDYNQNRHCECKPVSIISNVQVNQ